MLDEALHLETIAIAYTSVDVTLHGAYGVALAARHGAGLWTCNERVDQDFSWRVL